MHNIYLKPIDHLKQIGFKQAATANNCARAGLAGVEGGFSVDFLWLFVRAPARGSIW